MVQTVAAADSFALLDVNAALPYNENTPIQFNLLAQNYEDSNKTVQVTAASTLGGVTLDNNFVFNALETKALQFSLVLQPGAQTVSFTATDPNDTNTENNSAQAQLTVNATALPNLRMQFFDVNNLQAEQGADIKMFFTFINDGNAVADGNFLLKVINDDGLTIFSKTYANLAQQTTVSNFFVYNYKGENFFQSTVDANNSVAEENELDNTQTIFMANIDGADLTVSGADITHTTPTLNNPMEIGLKIKNTGNVGAANVRVFGYINEVNPNNLIYDRTFLTIAAHSDVNATFNYTPTVAGFKQLTIIVDPLNAVEEINENNNEATTGFTVALSNDNNNNANVSNTLIFEIHEECAAFLSNGHQLISKGIVSDVNVAVEGTERYINLKLFDKSGNLLINGDFNTSDEAAVPGVTLRVLDVSEFVARVLLIYQEEVSTNFNSCILDVRKAISDIEYYQNQFQQCQEILNNKTLELNEVKGEKIGSTTALTNCASELSTCVTNRSDLQVDFQEAVNSCDERVNIALTTSRTDNETARSILLDTKNSELNSVQQQKTVFEKQLELVYMLAGFVFLAVGAFLIYRFKKKNEGF